jgi:hypothetical protein
VTPLSLRRHLPRSLNAGRWIAVLVSYLDDSGKDRDNRDTCLGGYVLPEAGWEIFEREAEPIFQQYIGNTPLHAKDLYHGEGLYDGWKVVRKQAFVAKLCLKLLPLKPFGVSFSVRKAPYATRAAEALKRGLRKRTSTPYTFCMIGILNWLLTDVHVGKMANEDGLAMILEDGNEHNEEAKKSLDAIKKLHDLEQVRSLSFISKTSCRAIQMADLFAFYTRRHNRQIEEFGQKFPIDPVLQVILENLRHKTFVATDFGPDINASRFWQGDP